MQIWKLAVFSVLIVLLLIAISIYVIEFKSAKQSNNAALKNNTSEISNTVTQSETGNLWDKNKESHSKNTNTTLPKSNTSFESTGIPTSEKTARLKSGILYKSNDSFDAWVVVNCDNRLILKCPHKLIKEGTTQTLYATPRIKFLHGKCEDITVDTRSFCGF